MRYYYLCVLFTALLAAGCSSTPPKKKNTCGVDKTLLDGTCVSQEVADYVSCVRSQSLEIDRKISKNINAEIRYLGIGLEGASEFSENLSKKYSASDAVMKEIIERCDRLTGLHRNKPVPIKRSVSVVGTVTDTDFQVIRSSNELDFMGDIVYAINFNGRGMQKIGDSVFQNVLSSGNGAPPGVNVYGFNVDTLWGGGSNLRINDDGPLENILRSIIWSRGISQGGIELSVEPNNTYRLQLLFSEGCCNNRNFNVTINGVSEAKARGIDAGGKVWRNSTDRGYAFVQDFFTESESIEVNFTRNISGDTNYHISALTLEKIDE